MSLLLLLLLLLHVAPGAIGASTHDFPLLFDIGGRGLGTIPNLNKLVAATPRVQMHRIAECPHPCGLLPAINPSTGAVTNGGLPQLTNLTLHFATLEDTFAKDVPLNATGWLDLDYEGWPPLFDRASAVYQNASIALVKKAHPDYTADQLLAAATKEWEVAAMDLLVMTVEFVKKLRPGLNVSMYSYPDRVYWKGYNDSTAGPQLRKDNDRMFALWCVLDGLFPSVYQFYDSTGKPGVKAANEQYVFGNVNEAVRIAKEVPAKCPGRTAPPVWVYTWHRYHGAPNALLSDTDESMYWEQSYAAGATGLVLWGYEPTNSSAAEFGKWWKDDFTPLLNKWSPESTRHARET